MVFSCKPGLWNFDTSHDLTAEQIYGLVHGTFRFPRGFSHETEEFFVQSRASEIEKDICDEKALLLKHRYPAKTHPGLRRDTRPKNWVQNPFRESNTSVTLEFVGEPSTEGSSEDASKEKMGSKDKGKEKETKRVYNKPVSPIDPNNVEPSNVRKDLNLWTPATLIPASKNRKDFPDFVLGHRYEVNQYPTSVNLDDFSLYMVLKSEQFSNSTLHRNWPNDFDDNGRVKFRRKHFGFSAVEPGTRSYFRYELLRDGNQHPQILVFHGCPGFKLPTGYPQWKTPKPAEGDGNPPRQLQRLLEHSSSRKESYRGPVIGGQQEQSGASRGRLRMSEQLHTPIEPAPITPQKWANPSSPYPSSPYPSSPYPGSPTGTVASQGAGSSGTKRPFLSKLSLSGKRRKSIDMKSPWSSAEGNEVTILRQKIETLELEKREIERKHIVSKSIAGRFLARSNWLIEYVGPAPAAMIQGDFKWSQQQLEGANMDPGLLQEWLEEGEESIEVDRS